MIGESRMDCLYPRYAFRGTRGHTHDFNAGANLALLRRVAVSLLKRVKAKGSN